jgi:hypothetical protein
LEALILHGNDGANWGWAQGWMSQEGCGFCAAVFIVPFGFNGHAVFVVVDVVCRGQRLRTVSGNLDLKALLDPSALKKEPVNGS